jgi:hypothetical protein
MIVIFSVDIERKIFGGLSGRRGSIEKKEKAQKNEKE